MGQIISNVGSQGLNCSFDEDDAIGVPLALKLLDILRPEFVSVDKMADKAF